MNKKQIIKYGLRLLCILPLVALCIFGIVVLSSRSPHNATKEVSSKAASSDCTEDADGISESDEILQILKNARIEEANMRLWSDTLTYGSYNETINKEYIRGSEITKLYKRNTASSIENDVDYYFQTIRVSNGDLYHGFDCATYSMKDQSLLFRSRLFESTSLDDVQKELDARGAEYLGYITIDFPAPYIPTPHITERKQEMIDVLKDSIKNFIIENFKYEKEHGNDFELEPGKYPVYILNFMTIGPCSGTEWMIYDEKNKHYYTNTMVINDDLKCGPASPHFFMQPDEDLDGIMYSELFIKLSISNFTVVIE